jgi:hypothetical protein
MFFTIIFYNISEFFFSKHYFNIFVIIHFYVLKCFQPFLQNILITFLCSLGICPLKHSYAIKLSASKSVSWPHSIIYWNSTLLHQYYTSSWVTYPNNKYLFTYNLRTRATFHQNRKINISVDFTCTVIVYIFTLGDCLRILRIVPM